jgi:hypothetical protein
MSLTLAKRLPRARLPTSCPGFLSTKKLSARAKVRSGSPEFDGNEVGRSLQCGVVRRGRMGIFGISTMESYTQIGVGGQMLPERGTQL